MSDALGQDQFQPVNRRAGYGDALEMALSAARKGWTLSAGQGLLIIEHYEEKLVAARTVTDAMVELAVVVARDYWGVHNVDNDDIRVLLTAARNTPEDA